MNELKPEDVMRALDILDKMDFFQGQRAGRELWFEKPFEVQEQDIADFSKGIAFVKNIIADADARALIREMKKQIRKLEDDAENYRSIAEFQQNCNVNRYHIIKEKDAEIERLTKEFLDYQADVKMEIDDARDEAITEFAERLRAELLEKDFYPVIVKNAIEKIAKEMKGEKK